MYFRMKFVLVFGATILCLSHSMAPDADEESEIDEEEILRYNGVHCYECDDKYDGPCPLHFYKHIKDYKTNYEYFFKRAEKTAPRNILKIEESSIPGAGFGVYTIKKIPKDVLFGPLDGKLVERPNSTINDNYWKMPGTNNTYIDLNDKSKANYMTFINCARNQKEENLIRIYNETEQKFYFKSKQVIPKYSELLIDYGTDFRKTIGISDADYLRTRDLRRNVFQCDKCLKVSYTPVSLMPKHYCPKPTKEDDLWTPLLKNKTLIRKEVTYEEKENPNAFRTIFNCKICKKNSTKKIMSPKEMQTHFYYRHDSISGFNRKTLIRDDFNKLNKLCYRYYKCNICSNQSQGLNWTITPPRDKESIEIDAFFDKLNKAIAKHTVPDERLQLMENVGDDVRETESTTKLFELTTLNYDGQNITRIKHKLNKKIYFKKRSDAQCHFKKIHKGLCNVSDVRVMQYQGNPHECSLCGNSTQREFFDIDHHVDFHLNFSEMFDRGIAQLDYRTKQFNEPYIENFNFSHIFCTKCNQYIDTDKNHEPERDEIMKHKLNHVDLGHLMQNDYVEKNVVQIANRSPLLKSNKTFYHCKVCNNFTALENKSIIINHINTIHNINHWDLKKRIPLYLENQGHIICERCNETFDTKSQKIVHLQNKHFMYYYCYLCGKTNYYRKVHRKHVLIKHNNSTATPLIDDWDAVENLWTYTEDTTTIPTEGDDIFDVDSADYAEETVRHFDLDNHI